MSYTLLQLLPELIQRAGRTVSLHAFPPRVRVYRLRFEHAATQLTMTTTVSEGKKAAFEQQFACSGPASPPREQKVRTVVDGVAALDKYTTGGVNFKSMTSAPPQA